MVKNISGKIFALLNPFFKNRNNDIAIVIYRIVQTGAKIQSGGLNGALSKL